MARSEVVEVEDAYLEHGGVYAHTEVSHSDDRHQLRRKEKKNVENMGHN